MLSQHGELSYKYLVLAVKSVMYMFNCTVWSSVRMLSEFRSLCSVEVLAGHARCTRWASL